jgi:alpha-1,3-rhamnosyl/mannosyltransferase
VLPSLREGFGLPVLEAMARGVPVACSDIPALREVTADAALRFDPRDPYAIAAALNRILDDRELALELVRRGRERCARHPWERTARATVDSYRRAVEEAPR